MKRIPFTHNGETWTAVFLSSGYLRQVEAADGEIFLAGDAPQLWDAAEAARPA